MDTFTLSSCLDLYKYTAVEIGYERSFIKQLKSFNLWNSSHGGAVYSDLEPHDWQILS